MKKRRYSLNILTASVLMLLATNSWGDCYPITGTVSLTPDLNADYSPACSIINRADTKKKHPEQTFLYKLDPSQLTCFKSTFAGAVGKQKVLGAGVSGLTVGVFDGAKPLTIEGYQPFTAATTLTVTDVAKNILGILYLSDTGVISYNDLNDPSDDIAHERLVVKGGAGIFQKVTSGYLDIAGNEFAPIEANANVVSGRVCQ